MFTALDADVNDAVNPVNVRLIMAYPHGIGAVTLNASVLAV